MNAIVDGVLRTDPDREMPNLPAGVSGVFETLLWQRGELVFASAHWARFEAGCRWHGFLPPVSAAEFEHSVRALLANDAVDTGVVRLATWRVAPSRTTWRIDVGAPRPHMAKPEFGIGWGTVLPATSEDRAFKHLNRSAWAAALRTARRDGFDEALLTDARGQVVEACVSNVFVVADGRVRTPALEAGPLPGIMRAEVIRQARAQGLSVEETAISRAEVEAATEIWLTNSLIGVRPVAVLSGRRLPTSRPVLDSFAPAWKAALGWHPVVIAGIC